jgi:hypothetical protein
MILVSMKLPEEIPLFKASRRAVVAAISAGWLDENATPGIRRGWKSHETSGTQTLFRSPSLSVVEIISCT